MSICVGWGIFFVMSSLDNECVVVLPVGGCRAFSGGDEGKSRKEQQRAGVVEEEAEGYNNNCDPVSIRRTSVEKYAKAGEGGARIAPSQCIVWAEKDGCKGSGGGLNWTTPR